MASLTAACIGYALLLAVVAVFHAITGRPRPRAFGAGLVVVELAVLVLTAASAWQQLHHGGSTEPATLWGYLAAAPLLIPAAAGALRSSDHRWTCAGHAVTCLIVAVVVFRIHQTQGTPA